MEKRYNDKQKKFIVDQEKHADCVYWIKTLITSCSDCPSCNKYVKELKITAKKIFDGQDELSEQGEKLGLKWL